MTGLLQNNRNGFYKTLLALALPVALQNLVASSLNLIDTVMIGRLGQSELAAVGIANQVYFLLILFLFGICSGATVFTAQFWGKKDIANIRRILGIALMSGGSAAGLLAVVAFFFGNRIMSSFMANTDIIAYGSGYLQIVSLSYIFTAVTFAYGFIARSVNQAKLPMLVSVAGLACNAALNYLLIFGRFGLPALGVQGAAVATLIARAVEMVLLVILIYRDQGVLAASLRELTDFGAPYIRRFFHTVYTVVLNEMSWSLGVMVCMLAYARMGESAYAAVQMALPIQNMFFVLFIGIANAAAVMLGQQIGACREEDAFACAKRLAVLGPMLAVLVGAVIIAGAKWFVSGYNVELPVKANAAKILVVFALYLSVRVFNLINIIGILRSGGDTRFTFFLDSGGVWLVAVPLAFLGGVVWQLPVYLVLALVSTEEFVKMIFGLRRLYSKKWVRNVVSEMDIGL